MPRERKVLCPPSENYSHLYSQFWTCPNWGYHVQHPSFGIASGELGRTCKCSATQSCSITKLTDELSYLARSRIQLSNVTHWNLCGEHAPCLSSIFNFISFSTKHLLKHRSALRHHQPPHERAHFLHSFYGNKTTARPYPTTLAELLARAGVMNTLLQSHNWAVFIAIRAVYAAFLLLSVGEDLSILPVPILDLSLQRCAIHAHSLAPLLISWSHVSSKCCV